MLPTFMSPNMIMDVGEYVCAMVVLSVSRSMNSACRCAVMFPFIIIPCRDGNDGAGLEKSGNMTGAAKVGWGGDWKAALHTSLCLPTSAVTPSQ